MHRTAAFVAFLLPLPFGCSKQGDAPATGGDPDAAYALTFREPRKGDTLTITKTRDATATFTTPNSSQTKHEKYRYEFTEAILDTSPDERLPTKVTRVYRTAERADPDGKTRAASFVGKTITIERYQKGYNYAANGKTIPPTEQMEIADDFNRGGWKVGQMFPKEPVKIGQEWSVDFASITAIAGNPQTTYDKDRSKFTGKLARVYQKDGARWGVIEAKILLVMDAAAGKNLTPSGSVETDVVHDIVIDGSATAGTQRMTLAGKLEARDPVGGTVITTIAGTEERSVSPAK